jgi:hypothetical protein
MRVRVYRSCALLILVASAAACTDFQNPTTVIDLRILAVKVAPSEIILDADVSDPSNPTVDPANNPMVTVTPLIADPAGNGRPVTYSINACPNDPFAPAPPGGGQGGGAFPSGGARTTVGSALCDDPSLTWDLVDDVNAANSAGVQPTPDMLKEAFAHDVFPDQYGNIHGGFDLGMPLTLDIRVTAGTPDTGIEEIRGVKRVLYWLRRIDDQQMANQIPTIDTLSMFNDREDTTFDPIDTPQEIPPPDPNAPAPYDAVVSAGQRTIWILPSKGNAESYETTIIDSTTHQAVPYTVERETLRYRFFATAGTFGPPTTSSEPDPGFVTTGPVHIESEYSLPTSDKITVDGDGHAIVTIWVVVRDDRGGESWAERRLQITPPPPN